jgi:hypothetical protein
MSNRGYTVLGWAVWRIVTSLVKFKMRQNRVKLGAAATVLLVLIGGLAIARAAVSDDES